MTECVIIDLYSPLSSQNELTFYSHSKPSLLSLSSKFATHKGIRVKMFAVILRVSTAVFFSRRENETKQKKWWWSRSSVERALVRERFHEMGKVFAFFENLHHPTESQSDLFLANTQSLSVSHFLAFYLGGWARMNMSGCRFPIWDKLSPLFRGASALCLLFNQISSYYDEVSTKESNDVVKVSQWL